MMTTSATHVRFAIRHRRADHTTQVRQPKAGTITKLQSSSNIRLLIKGKKDFTYGQLSSPVEFRVNFLWLYRSMTISLLWIAISVVATNERQATKPLEIFLVPHTHADTGWMITMEEYYEQLVSVLQSYLMALRERS